MTAKSVVMVMILRWTTVVLGTIARGVRVMLATGIAGTMLHSDHFARVYAKDPPLESEKDAKQQEP